MSKRTKWTIAGIVVLAIAGIAGSAAAKKGNKATEVRIEGVEARDLVASVTASGQVRPRTKVDLSADITGKITRLAVKDGDYVKQGQFLLQIDPQQFDAAVQRSEAALSNARARLAQAKASLIQSQRNYQRSAEIKKSAPTLISDEQLERLSQRIEG